MNNTYVFSHLQVADLHSPLNKQWVHLLVKEGKAYLSTREWNETDAVYYACKGAYISAGLVDLSFGLPDPGMEHRESFESAAHLALKSGYTHLCCLPDTFPVADTKSAILYTLRHSQSSPIDFIPMAALSKGLKGEELAELYDMKMAGAAVFSTADKSPVSTNLLLKALEYTANMNTPIFYFPFKPALSKGGMVHESSVTAGLGLKGLAPITEYLPVQEAIELVRYTHTSIHFTGISCKESVEAIRKAKKEGLAVTCDVRAMNLLFLDSDLSHFDTAYKVLPPLRDAHHRQALIDGLLDGTIDAISSGHRPLDPEVKEVEFLYAAFGASTLESIWPQLLANFGETLGVDVLAAKCSQGPAHIVGIPTQPMTETTELSHFILTFPDTPWTLNLQNNASLSTNSPFIGKTHSYKVGAVFSKSNLHVFLPQMA